MLFKPKVTRKKKKEVSREAVNYRLFLTMITLHRDYP